MARESIAGSLGFFQRGIIAGMNPRYAYALIGVGFIVLIGGTWYYSRSGHPTVREATPTMELTLSSSAFENNGKIPEEYSCDAGTVAVSPPLSIHAAPEGTKSYALIVEDPDVPKQLKPDGVFVHWVLFNIPADTREIPSGTTVGVSGANGAGKNAYAGPCPPPQYEPSEHRYVFTLYALDTMLALEPGASKDAVLKSMQEHVLERVQLIGTYKRK